MSSFGLKLEQLLTYRKGLFFLSATMGEKKQTNDFFFYFLALQLKKKRATCRC